MTEQEQLRDRLLERLDVLEKILAFNHALGERERRDYRNLREESWFWVLPQLSDAISQVEKGSSQYEQDMQDLMGQLW